MKSYWSLCSCIHYPEWLTEPLKLQPNDITTTSLWHHCSRTGYVTCWCSLVILRGYQHSWVHSVTATLTHNAVHVPDTILYILYSQLGILIPNSDVLRTCLLEPCLHDVLWYLLCTLLKQVLCTCNTQNVWIEYYRFPIVRATPSPPHLPTHPHTHTIHTCTHMHTYAHIHIHTHTLIHLYTLHPWSHAPPLQTDFWDNLFLLVVRCEDLHNSISNHFPPPPCRSCLLTQVGPGGYCLRMYVERYHMTF